MAPKVDPLIRQEVARGTEYLFHVVLGEDLDKGAIHVKGDRPYVHDSHH